MQQKWRYFWTEGFRKSFRSLLLWPPISGTIVLVFNLNDWLGAEDKAARIFSYYMYSFIIIFSISLAYWIAWAVATAIGSEFIDQMRRRILIHIGVCLTGVAAGVVLAETIAHRFLGQPPASFSLKAQDFFIGAIISLCFIYYAAYRSYLTRSEQLQKTALQNQLSALRAQMQPHFLFNSLNSLSELIELSPAAAGQLSQRLADLYRDVLESSKQQLSPLSKELAIAKNYLEIEKVRLGDRLKYQVPTDDAPDLHLPSLMLQTLVENAVKHGIAPCESGGKISIEFRRPDARSMQVSICNTGKAFDRSRNQGTGLANSRERLNLHFGKDASLNIYTHPDQSTEVAVDIPVNKNHD
jgi:two-component system LytT family sensor kinase